MSDFIYDMYKFMFLDMKVDEQGNYEFENAVTDEKERIQIMDSLTDGHVSYYLDILNKWNADYDSIPSTSSGTRNKRSVVAWYKRNDKLSLISVEMDTSYWMVDTSRAIIYFFGEVFYAPIYRLETFSSSKYKNNSLVDELFYCMCKSLINKETNYFNNLSIFGKKCHQIKKLYNQTKEDFNSIIVQDILSSNDIERFTIEELDKIIFCYEQFNSIKKMEKEISSWKNQVLSFANKEDMTFDETSINHEYTNEIYAKGFENGNKTGFNKGANEQKYKMIRGVETFRSNLIYGHPAKDTLYNLVDKLQKY